MKKRTKIIVIVAMVALLGVTGYLNLTLNNRIIDTSSSNHNYFDSFIEKRQQTRQDEFLYYDAIINSEASTEIDIQNAQKSKLELIANMEKELIMEELITAKGFENALVTYSSSYINVIVKGALDRAGASQITAIVRQQTGADIEYIKITEV